MDGWAVPGYAESRELGAGASGRVVLAVHEPTGVPVAVKYLSDSLRTRPGFVHGFRAEAELLGGLRSPYVAGLYEYVEATDGAAIVMELVDGVPLRAVLAREGALPPEAALAVLKGSLLGLADAHRVGVVHRDYKPENVLVSPEGGSKLVDFGIAVDAGVLAGVAGTPAYMAPEQWTGAPASPAGDVYAATATFFECLTGHRPYRGENLAELALQHVEGAVPVGEVPEAVRPLVGRGLAKSPAERPSDAAAFVADLERVATTAYGPDWEERGRGRLAALAALLLFLRPPVREAPGAATDTARTVFRPGAGPGRLRPWRPTLPGVVVSAAAVLVAVLLAEGLGPAGGARADAGAAGRVLATTTAVPDRRDIPVPADPSASASPSVAVPSAPGTQSAGVTTGPAVGGTPTAAASGTPSAVPSPSTPGGGASSAGPSASASPGDSSPSPPGPPAVKDVTVTDFRQTGPGTATADLTVVTDGTGPLSVTVDWFSADAAGQAGGADGEATVRRLSDATRYTLTVDHVFSGGGCQWTVRVTSAPAAAGGTASRQLTTRQCDLR